MTCNSSANFSIEWPQIIGKSLTCIYFVNFDRSMKQKNRINLNQQLNRLADFRPWVSGHWSGPWALADRQLLNLLRLRAQKQILSTPSCFRWANDDKNTHILPTRPWKWIQIPIKFYPPVPYLGISLPKTNSETINQYLIELDERISMSTPDSTSEFYFELDGLNDKLHGTFKIIIE